MSVYIIKYYDKELKATVTKRFMGEHFPYSINVEDVVNVIKYPVCNE